jgi:hypothetical protein
MTCSSEWNSLRTGSRMVIPYLIVFHTCSSLKDSRLVSFKLMLDSTKLPLINFNSPLRLWNKRAQKRSRQNLKMESTYMVYTLKVEDGTERINTSPMLNSERWLKQCQWFTSNHKRITKSQKKITLLLFTKHHSELVCFPPPVNPQTSFCMSLFQPRKILTSGYREPQPCFVCSTIEPS